MLFCLENLFSQKGHPRSSSPMFDDGNDRVFGEVVLSADAEDRPVGPTSASIVSSPSWSTTISSSFRSVTEQSHSARVN